MSMGEILRTAREQRGLTTSSVAESTHMKVQIIEDLENEDFRRIAAPIYGRGFVKLYAEFLELDSAPLTREFMDLYSGKRAPAVGRRPVETTPVPSADPEPSAPVTRTVRSVVAATTQALVKPLVRHIEPAPAPEPQPSAPAPTPIVATAAVPQPRPSPAPHPQPLSEPDLDDDPLTLTPTLTPTHHLTPGPAKPEERPEQPKEPFDAPQSTEPESDPNERRWVVEPEAPFSDPNGEPDLFSMNMPQKQPVTATPLATMEAPRKKAPSQQKRRSGPIFDMSRLDTSPVPDATQDEKSVQRQHEHLKTFVESFKRLKTSALSRSFTFSDDFLHQYRYALMAAGAILLIFMLTGITLLFTMTSKEPKLENSSRTFQQVAPIPHMYAD